MSQKLFLLSLFLSVRGQDVISSTRATSTKYNLLLIYLHICLIHILDQHLIICSYLVLILLVILRTMGDPQYRQTTYLKHFWHISGIFMVKPTSITCIILEFQGPYWPPYNSSPCGLLCIYSFSWGRPSLLKNCWDKSHLEISFTDKWVLYIE